MNYLIIDSNLNKYSPQIILSEIYEAQDNVLGIIKNKNYYIYIDDVNLFNKFNLKDTNYNFIIDKDVKINKKNLLVKKISSVSDDADFKRKVCKHEFIYQWLFNRSKK